MHKSSKSFADIVYFIRLQKNVPIFFIIQNVNPYNDLPLKCEIKKLILKLGNAEKNVQIRKYITNSTEKIKAKILIKKNKKLL